MSAIIDAGLLIWLAKCNLLHLLRNMFSNIMITEAYNEAATVGFEAGYTDAESIAKAIEEGWFTVHQPPRANVDEVKKTEDELGIQLEAGERESIALSKSEKTKTFLSND